MNRHGIAFCVEDWDANEDKYRTPDSEVEISCN